MEGSGQIFKKRGSNNNSDEKEQDGFNDLSSLIPGIGDALESIKRAKSEAQQRLDGTYKKKRGCGCGD